MLVHEDATAWHEGSNDDAWAVYSLSLRRLPTGRTIEAAFSPPHKSLIMRTGTLNVTALMVAAWRPDRCAIHDRPLAASEIALELCTRCDINVHMAGLAHDTVAMGSHDSSTFRETAGSRGLQARIDHLRAPRRAPEQAWPQPAQAGRAAHRHPADAFSYRPYRGAEGVCALVPQRIHHDRLRAGVDGRGLCLSVSDGWCPRMRTVSSRAKAKKASCR
jgi:hypothetical protein